MKAKGIGVQRDPHVPPVTPGSAAQTEGRAILNSTALDLVRLGRGSCPMSLLGCFQPWCHQEAPAQRCLFILPWRKIRFQEALCYFPIISAISPLFILPSFFSFYAFFPPHVCNRTASLVNVQPVPRVCTLSRVCKDVQPTLWMDLPWGK